MTARDLTPEQLEAEIESARVKFEEWRGWHDDKPDGRPDMHISIGPGDLDCVGRPLRAGT